MPQQVLEFTDQRLPQSGERRRYPRRLSEQIVVTFLGADHEPITWSLGGFLIADRHPHCVIASITEGFVSIRGRNGRFPCRLQLVRRDLPTGQIAFRFIDPSQALMNAFASITE